MGRARGQNQIAAGSALRGTGPHRSADTLPDSSLLDLHAQRFDSLFGDRRGEARSDSLRKHAHRSEQLTRILSLDGVEGAVRFYRSECGKLAVDAPLADVGAALADELILESYTRQRESLCNWTSAIAVRPWWCLNVAADGEFLHLLPNGHHHVTRGDWRNQRAACGHTSEHWMLLNRGCWAQGLASTNPAMMKPCSDCAQHADDYPETAAGDETDPIPAPALLVARREWEERARPQLVSGLARGDAIADLRQRADTDLPNLVSEWAADTIARHPYPNVLRALTSVNDPQLTAQRIADADLSAADYRELLVTHRRDNSLGDAGSSEAWVRLLSGIAPE